METPASPSSGTGTYPSTPSGLTSVNYLVTFVPSTVTVFQAGSATTLTSSSNPAGYMQPVALRAEVTPTPAGDGIATGTVEFAAGTTVLGAASVTAGAATINLVLPSGYHAITARYLGDTNVLASTATLTQVVNARNESSTTTLRVRPSQSLVGEAVTFDIDVSPASGSPDDTVLLEDDAGTTVTLALNAGRASYTTSSLSVGSHAFVATYAGNATTTSSASMPVIHTVVEGVKLERTTIRVSVRNVKAGEQIPVDLIVNGSGKPPPKGRVVCRRQLHGPAQHHQERSQ